MRGIENIQAYDGVGIALTGMCIVFTALILITFYIAWLPWVLKHLAKILPEPEGHYHRVEDQEVQEEDLMIAAAIAAALRRRQKLQEQVR